VTELPAPSAWRACPSRSCCRQVPKVNAGLRAKDALQRARAGAAPARERGQGARLARLVLEPLGNPPGARVARPGKVDARRAERPNLVEQHREHVPVLVHAAIEAPELDGAEHHLAQERRHVDDPDVARQVTRYPRLGVVVSELRDQPWGERNFYFDDPDGYVWAYGEPRR